MATLGDAHCLVVKIGSALLVDQDTGALRQGWLTGLAQDVADARARGAGVSLVSSGSIALGGRVLRRPAGARPLEQAQAAAAVGQIRLARAALKTVPDGHPFQRNPHLGDHRDSDAGFYDLLLHSRDRAYDVVSFLSALDRAGLGLASFLESARYDPASYLPADAAYAARIKALSSSQRMTVAEQLAGNIKTHVAYVTHADRASKAVARPTKPELVPHITGVAPSALAKQIRDKGRLTASFDGESMTVDIPNDAHVLIGRVNNARTLGQMSAGEDWMAFSTLWGPVHRALTGFNLLHYSTGAGR